MLFSVISRDSERSVISSRVIHRPDKKGIEDFGEGELENILIAELPGLGLKLEDLIFGVRRYSTTRGAGFEIRQSMYDVSIEPIIYKL